MPYTIFNGQGTMKLRALLLSALLLAGPAQAKSLPADHRQLLETMNENGVRVYINFPPQVCVDGRADGAYIGYNGSPNLVVCQDNYDMGEDTSVVDWTANDLDTIRHEAIHASQDCAVGTSYDNELALIFPSISEVVARLGIERARQIARVYAERGADEETIKHEFEAFYAATYLTASQIEEIYTYYCK